MDQTYPSHWETRRGRHALVSRCLRSQAVLRIAPILQLRKYDFSQSSLDKKYFEIQFFERKKFQKIVWIKYFFEEKNSCEKMFFEKSFSKLFLEILFEEFFLRNFFLEKTAKIGRGGLGATQNNFFAPVLHPHLPGSYRHAHIVSLTTH